ncbi:MAG: ribosome maturation factor RimP [Candidatus Omnitrophota bacterium]
MDHQAIIEKIRVIADPVLSELGMELVDMLLRHEGQGLILRLLVDKEGGVNMDDCTALNQQLSNALDEAKVIDRRYILEVSSPGLDRPLTTKRDFERVQDELVKILTNVPVADKTQHIGYVKEATEDKVVIETTDGLRLDIPLNKIQKAVREIEF